MGAEQAMTDKASVVDALRVTTRPRRVVRVGWRLDMDTLGGREECSDSADGLGFAP